MDQITETKRSKGRLWASEYLLSSLRTLPPARPLQWHLNTSEFNVGHWAYYEKCFFLSSQCQACVRQPARNTHAHTKQNKQTGETRALLGNSVEIGGNLATLAMGTTHNLPPINVKVGGQNPSLEKCSRFTSMFLGPHLGYTESIGTVTCSDYVSY